MILTKKALIDFRNWLMSEYDLRWHEFEDMPECGQVGYYLKYFSENHIEWIWRIIKSKGVKYNEKHDKINWKEEHDKYKLNIDNKPDGSLVVNSVKTYDNES